MTPTFRGFHFAHSSEMVSGPAVPVLGDALPSGDLDQVILAIPQCVRRFIVSDRIKSTKERRGIDADIDDACGPSSALICARVVDFQQLRQEPLVVPGEGLMCASETGKIEHELGSAEHCDQSAEQQRRKISAAHLLDRDQSTEHHGRCIVAEQPLADIGGNSRSENQSREIHDPVSPIEDPHASCMVDRIPQRHVPNIGTTVARRGGRTIGVGHFSVPFDGGGGGGGLWKTFGAELLAGGRLTPSELCSTNDSRPNWFPDVIRGSLDFCSDISAPYEQVILAPAVVLDPMHCTQPSRSCANGSSVHVARHLRLLGGGGGGGGGGRVPKLADLSEPAGAENGLFSIGVLRCYVPHSRPRMGGASHLNPRPNHPTPHQGQSTSITCPHTSPQASNRKRQCRGAWPDRPPSSRGRQP